MNKDTFCVPHVFPELFNYREHHKIMFLFMILLLHRVVFLVFLVMSNIKCVRGLVIFILYTYIGFENTGNTEVLRNTIDYKRKKTKIKRNTIWNTGNTFDYKSKNYMEGAQ